MAPCGISLKCTALKSAYLLTYLLLFGCSISYSRDHTMYSLCCIYGTECVTYNKLMSCTTN